MDNLDEYQTRRKAAEERRRKNSDDRKANPVRKGSWWKRFLIRFSIVFSIILLVTAILKNITPISKTQSCQLSVK